MARKILVLLIATATLVMATHEIKAADAQQRPTSDYMLDDGISGFALYSGNGYRSWVEEKDKIASFEDLEQRVSRLPQGTKLYWTPYRRDGSGRPILFSEGSYERFARLCRERGIDLVLPDQSSKVEVSKGTVQASHVSVMKDGKPVNVDVRQEEVSIGLPNGSTSTADVILLREPKSGLFWWRFQGLSPGQHLTKPALYGDYVVYISAGKVFGFTFAQPSLWIRESGQHYSGLDQGEAAVLDEIKSKVGEIQVRSGGAYFGDRSVNLGRTLASDFLHLRNSASPFPQARIRSVSRSNGTWHLILDGPNKDTAEAVLSDDYQIISTTYFPLNSLPDKD